MGSSAIAFRQKMAWTNDHFLQVWLALLVREVDALTDPHPALVALRDDWRIMACHAFTGHVNHHVTEDIGENGMNALISICNSALEKLDVDDPAVIRGDIIDCSDFTEPSWESLSPAMTAAQVYDIGSAFIEIMMGSLPEAAAGRQWYVGFRGGRRQNRIRVGSARKAILKALRPHVVQPIEGTLPETVVDEFDLAADLADEESDPHEPLNRIVEHLAAPGVRLSVEGMCLLEDLAATTPRVNLSALEEEWRGTAINIRSAKDVRYLRFLADELRELHEDPSADPRRFQRLLAVTADAVTTPIYHHYLQRISESMTWAFEEGGKVPAASRAEVLEQTEELRGRIT